MAPACGYPNERARRSVRPPVAVVAPAHRRAVRAQPARMSPACRHRSERALGSVRLPVVVTAPAHRGAVAAQSARMEPACRYRSEPGCVRCAGVRGGFLAGGGSCAGVAAGASADKLRGVPSGLAPQAGHVAPEGLRCGHRCCAAQHEPARCRRLETRSLAGWHRRASRPGEDHAVRAEHACERYGAVDVRLRLGVGADHDRHVALAIRCDPPLRARQIRAAGSRVGGNAQARAVRHATGRLAASDTARFGTDELRGRPTRQPANASHRAARELRVWHSSGTTQHIAARCCRVQALPLRSGHRRASRPGEDHAVRAEHTCERYGAVDVRLRLGVGADHDRHIAAAIGPRPRLRPGHVRRRCCLCRRARGRQAKGDQYRECDS